jgi:hypothetical protein
MVGINTTNHLKNNTQCMIVVENLFDELLLLRGPQQSSDKGFV